MKKILFLMPNLTSAKKLEDDLMRHGSHPSHLHILAKNQIALTYFKAKKISFTEYSDLIPSIIKGSLFGAAIGGLTFFLAGLFFSIYSLSVANEISIIFLFAILGAWAASLMGVSVIKPKYDTYYPALKEGKVIFIVDSVSAQLKKLMLNTHPVENCAVF